MPDEKIRIAPAKGRPMLRWIGKKPLDYVKGFPAQLVEVFDPLNTSQKFEIPTYEDLKDNWQNFLFHGDNKEVMAALLENGFRGEIDLIYIDPPFMSGADYVRKVRLRGVKAESVDLEEASILQQTMYEDIWNNDSYLQFMYERLMLMRELLSNNGCIYVHLDWHVGHYVKLVMDEIFGREKLLNEIVWSNESVSGFKSQANKFIRGHDTILLYAQDSKKYTFNKEHLQKFSAATIRRYDKTDESGRKYKIYFEDGEERRQYLDESEGLPLADVWTDIPSFQTSNIGGKHTGFSTQKPDPLIERIINTSSNTNDLVLDCFIGSGTTAAAAQRLGRRWIGCDINKGAIQTTSHRLQKIILEQIKKEKKAKIKDEESPRYYSFGIYQVNNYDLQLLKTEAMELAVQHIGIQRMRTDTFFDGTLGKSLVKIVDFNHPFTLLDWQLIQDELKKRPNEDRDITIVCLGKELAVDPEIDSWNKKHPVNKIKVIELKTDKKYGNFLIHKPAEAKVSVKKLSGNKALVEIKDFISPTIIERLNIDSGLFKVKIPDFRSMIDTVLIDNNYDGKVFHIVYSEVPEKKDDLVKGEYEIELPNPKAKVAVKIVDMLGEKVLIECLL
jgi:DNA modification methylase